MERLIYALAVAILSFCFASPAVAEDRHDNNNAVGAKLEGTWWFTVERPGTGLPPLVSLQTYTAKGGMVGTNTTANVGPTHGNWVKTGNRRFTVTLWVFRFDAARQHVGYNRVSINLRFVAPDQFRSVNRVEVYDLNWNPLEIRYDNGVGTRLPIVHFPEQP